MNSRQTYTFGGILLLGTAIPIILSSFRDHSGSPQGFEVVATSNTSFPPEALDLFEGKSRRNPRRDLEGEFAELAARYGESEARRAKALASQGLDFIREEELMSDRSGLLLEAVGREIEALSETLRLNQDQQALLEAMQGDIADRRSNDLKAKPLKIEENLPALTEILLAIDAVSRGKISEETFQQVIRNRNEALRVGSHSILDSLGIVTLSEDELYRIEDPLMGQPEQAMAFSEQLTPEQRSEYQKIRDESAAHATAAPELCKSDLKGLSITLTAVMKIRAGSQMISGDDPTK